MVKRLLFILTVWFLLFTLRVWEIGGIDPAYKDQEVKLFASLRDFLTQNIDKQMAYPQSGLLSGILLGSRDKLPFYLQQDLKTTSTIHMIVVSGQNLTLLAGFLMSLVGWLGRKKTVILTLTVIFGYSILTGLEVPVVRAAIMATLAYLAQLSGKEGSGWWILLLTAGAMLLFNPNWLLSISFQLSFLATLGVVTVSPIIAAFFQSVPQLIRQDLAVTLAAQALVMPIIAYNFNQLSLIGIIANLFLLWTMPFVMIGGIIGIGAGLIVPVFGQIILLAPGILLTYFLTIVELFAGIPGASIKLGETTLLLWIGYYTILAGVILAINKKITN